MSPSARSLEVFEEKIHEMNLFFDSNFVATPILAGCQQRNIGRVCH